MLDELVKAFSTRDHEKIPRDEHTFAIQAQLVLRNNYTTMGALTVEESGLLRMAQPGFTQNPNSKHAPAIPLIANHYFSVDDIVALILVDMIPESDSRSRIVTG